jgi:DNA-binding MarR family transcriptional regulator
MSSVTTSPEGHDEMMIGALVSILSLELRQRVEARLGAEGFDDYRPTHQAVFQWLGPDGDRVSDLAQHAGMTRQSIAELVDYLEAHGYVERVPDPSDGRAVLVRRTERGWTVNRTARRVIEETQAEWARSLGHEEFDQLLDHLRRLAGVIQRPAGVAGHPRTRTRGDAR